MVFYYFVIFSILVSYRQIFQVIDYYFVEYYFQVVIFISNFFESNYYFDFLFLFIDFSFLKFQLPISFFIIKFLSTFLKSCYNCIPMLTIFILQIWIFGSFLIISQEELIAIIIQLLVRHHRTKVIILSSILKLNILKSFDFRLLFKINDPPLIFSELYRNILYQEVVLH